MEGVLILFKATSEDDEEDLYYTSLEAAGYKPQLITPIDFVFCNESELLECVSNPSRYAGLILSSPRCVRAISRVAQGNNIELSKWSSLPCFVVGETTDKLAKELGFVTCGKESGNAACLGDFIATRCFSKPLLYPVGSLTKDTLKNRLAEAEIRLDIHVVYETQVHPKLETTIASILPLLPAFFVFFSPSGVESVLAQFKKREVNLENQKIIAIGPTTEKCLKDNRIAVSATCGKPTPAALLEAVKSVS